MVFKTRIDGKTEVISDEFNESFRDVADEVRSLSKNGNLLLLMRKYRLSDDGVEPVMRWALFEFNPSTKKYVLKLKWETDSGQYVSPSGSRFKDHPSYRVQRRGTLRAHMEYQRIGNLGGRGTARHRKQEGYAHWDRQERNRDDAIDYMVKDDRETMKKIAEESYR